MKEGLWEFLEDQQSKGNEGSFVNTKAGFPVPNLELEFEWGFRVYRWKLGWHQSLGKVLEG